MAPNIITEQEMFWSTFEPKMKNRWLMSLDGVPTYIIKKAARPHLTQERKEIPHINLVRYVKGRSKWETIDLTLYDPVAPSGEQAVMEWIRLHHESVTGRDGYMAFYKKDIVLDMLGPVGDVVSRWVLKGSFITDVNFGDIDYNTDDLAEITLTISMDLAINEF